MAVVEHELAIQFAGLLVTIKRAGKIIQADQAHGHVVQRDGDSFPLFMFRECLVRPFVMREGVLEAVLAMKNVAHVVFEACHSQGLPEILEDLPRLIGRLERTLVFANEDRRLNGMAQGAGRLHALAKRFKQLEGSFVVLEGKAVFSAGVEGVRFGPEGKRQVFLAPEFLSNQERGFGQAQRLRSVYADSFHNEISELLDEFRAQQDFVPRKEVLPDRTAIKAA